MDSQIVEISISQVIADKRLQNRESMNEQVIDEYASLLSQHPDNWPFNTPITVFEIDGKLYVADGFHRFKACLRSGCSKLSAFIRTGTWDDAVEFSLSANATHGLRRSNADKRKSVHTALSTDSIRSKSNREIARTCQVSEKLVRIVKEEREEQWQSQKKALDESRDRLIADELRLGHTLWSTAPEQRREMRANYLSGFDVMPSELRALCFDLILDSTNPASTQGQQMEAVIELHQVKLDWILSEVESEASWLTDQEYRLRVLGADKRTCAASS